MLKKPKYRWKNHTSRSVWEIVSEDGVMSLRDIYYVIEKLCILPDIRNITDISIISSLLHPHNVFLKNDGSVYLSDTHIPLALREAYIALDNDKSDRSVIYALGTLMLFMATGNVKKPDIDTFIEDNVLKSIIEYCITLDPDSRYNTVDEFYNEIKHAKRNLKTTTRYFIVFSLLFFSLVIIFYFYQKGKFFGEEKGIEIGFEKGYAYGFEKGFADAPGIGINGAPFIPDNGNLLGNMVLEKGAFTAFSENEVFFIYENNIYIMNPYTEDIKILIKDVQAYGLNYYDGWLYYSSDKQILRFSLQAMKEEVFLDFHSGLLYIVDGEFYFNDLNGTGYLYKVNKNNKELTQLNGMNKYICLNIIDDKLYYIDDKNKSIYKCDLDGDNIKLINSNSFESFSIYGNKIYAHTTGFKNNEIDYSMSFLISMDLDGGNMERITGTPAYYINVTDGGIYYVDGNNKTLNWMSLDGRVQYTILSSPTGMFNIAGRWIFYINEEDKSLWRVSIDGSKNRKIYYD